MDIYLFYLLLSASKQKSGLIIFERLYASNLTIFGKTSTSTLAVSGSHLISQAADLHWELSIKKINKRNKRPQTVSKVSLCFFKCVLCALVKSEDSITVCVLEWSGVKKPVASCFVAALALWLPAGKTSVSRMSKAKSLQANRQRDRDASRNVHVCTPFTDHCFPFSYRTGQEKNIV